MFDYHKSTAKKWDCFVSQFLEDPSILVGLTEYKPPTAPTLSLSSSTLYNANISDIACTFLGSPVIKGILPLNYDNFLLLRDYNRNLRLVLENDKISYDKLSLGFIDDRYLKGLQRYNSPEKLLKSLRRKIDRANPCALEEFSQVVFSGGLYSFDALLTEKALPLSFSFINGDGERIDEASFSSKFGASYLSSFTFLKTPHSTKLRLAYDYFLSGYRNILGDNILEHHNGLRIKTGIHFVSNRYYGLRSMVDCQDGYDKLVDICSEMKELDSRCYEIAKNGES